MRAVPKVSVVAVLTLMVLAGCNSAGEPGLETSGPTEAPSTSIPDETVATTSTPSEAEREDAGQQAAVQTVVEFWATVDRLSQNPDAPIQDIAQVADGQAVQQWVSIIESRREEGIIQTGNTQVKVVEVETVNQGQRYEVTACLDWSDVRANGEKPERGDFGDLQEATYVVSYAESAKSYYVSEDPLDYSACDG